MKKNTLLKIAVGVGIYYFLYKYYKDKKATTAPVQNNTTLDNSGNLIPLQVLSTTDILTDQTHSSVPIMESITNNFTTPAQNLIQDLNNTIVIPETYQTFYTGIAGVNKTYKVPMTF